MKKKIFIIVFFLLFSFPIQAKNCPSCHGCTDCGAAPPIINSKHAKGQKDLAKILAKRMERHRQEFWIERSFHTIFLPDIKKMAQQNAAGLSMENTIYMQKTDAKIAAEEARKRQHFTDQQTEEYALPLVPEGNTVGKVATAARAFDNYPKPETEALYVHAMGLQTRIDSSASPNITQAMANQWLSNCTPSTPGCKRENVDDAKRAEYNDPSILLTATTIPPERIPEVMALVATLCGGTNDPVNLSPYFLKTSEGQQAFLNENTQRARRSVACHSIVEIVGSKIGGENKDDAYLAAMAPANLAQYYGEHPSQEGIQKLVVHSLTDPKTKESLKIATPANAKRDENAKKTVEMWTKHEILESLKRQNALLAIQILQAQEEREKS